LCNYTQSMTDYERKKIEMQLRAFAAKNLEKPSVCQNLDQIRFYIRELTVRMEASEKEFGFVPEWAYSLLAQYNAAQNRFLHEAFKATYGVL
jgi:hypothetical protein